MSIDRTRARQECDDAAVDEAGQESFPASDPPAWEPLRAGAPSRSGADEHGTDDLRSDINVTARRR